MILKHFFSLGAKRDEHTNDLIYLVVFWGSNDSEQVSARNAAKYWPNAVIGFLEERLEWTRPVNNDAHVANDEQYVETVDDIHGEPGNISCKNPYYIHIYIRSYFVFICFFFQ